jgi:hypothetical protein
MDKDAIVKHVRPWQQMMMFFARTQKEHTWKSPAYRLTRRQQEAWEALVEQAEQVAGGEGEETEEAEGDQGIEDMDKEAIDEIDEEMDGIEEQDHTEPAESVKPKLSRIQKACLGFYLRALTGVRAESS